MTNLIAKSNIIVIIGMGVTGLSAARYLRDKGETFVWLDTRPKPPGLEAIVREFPSLKYELGELSAETLLMAEEIVVSPGVALTTPAIAAAVNAGVKVLGDIELFLRDAKAPVVAITGSNAKSTVTTLLGDMAKAAGKRVAVGGNIGVPVLELLSEEAIDLYVVELSSFQLETINKLNADVATVLNVTEDHMDRYDSLAQYHQAKLRIYYGARAVVFNRDDSLTAPPMATGVEYFSFGMGMPDRHGFGVVEVEDVEFLAFEFTPLLAISEIKLTGRHNVANALAALALGHAAGLPFEPMLKTLREFSGLPHRCQWVREANQITYYNDSKGTNVGATLAAINGLAKDDQKIVLIAGGVGKGADFSSLRKSVGHLRALVAIGADGGKIAEQFSGDIPVSFASSLSEAVGKATELAEPGDAVLLSPACASFDMFKGFEDRGQQFEQIVLEGWL